MDPKHLQGLMEAYSEVYAPIDENRMTSRMEKMPSAPAKVGKATHSIKDISPSKLPTPEEKAKARKALGFGEAVKGESSERRRDLAAQRRAGDKPLSPAKGRDNANKMQRDINYFDKLTKKNNTEEVEIFDTVLEFLQVEGYAETLEEAEWLMANVIDEEAIDIILEASYSAKAARAGKDIGKPGKAFEKIAASAAKRYGSKASGERVAGAVLAKLRKEETEKK
jgi:hypothetical protein